MVEQCGGLAGHGGGFGAVQDQHRGPFAVGLLTRHGRVRRVRVRRGSRPFRFGQLDDGVGVRAAGAERGHAGAARPSGLRPRHRLGEEADVARVPLHVGGRPVHVQGPRQHPVPHRHDRLDHAAHTRGGLRMPDVGLQRSQPQRPSRVPVLTVGRNQRLRLDRVTEAGAGAVGLDAVDVGGGQSGVGQGRTDDAFLRGAVGGRQSAARAVLVDGGAADHGEHGVPVAARVGQPLQQQHTDALGEPCAVGRIGERLAAAVGGERLLAAGLDEQVGAGQHGGTGRQGHGAVALAQRVAGQVEGDERGGAGGVDGDGGAFEAQRVGDAAGGDAARAAVVEVPLQPLGGAGHPGGVVVVHHPGEDAGAGGGEGLRVDAGAFDRLPGGFEQQPLLRVHRQRLARADPEEAGVELGGVVQESAVPHVGRAGPAPLLVVEGVEVPAAVGGELGDGVAALGDEPPQVLGAAHAAGVAAAHRDDRDGLRRALLGLLQAAAGLVKISRHQLEVVEQLLLSRHPVVRPSPGRWTAPR